MSEEWKDIDGYEGYYQISSYGRVKSLSRPIYKKDGTFHRYKKETIKKPKIDKDGYLTVTLSVDGINKTFPIHRLVANAFIPNADKTLEVNHIDLNRKNNCVNNLEWKSHTDNVKHSSEQGRYKCHSGSKNGRCVPVIVYDLNGNIIKSFEYGQECAIWMIENVYCKGTSPRSVLDGIRKSIKNNKPYYNFIVRYK